VIPPAWPGIGLPARTAVPFFAPGDLEIHAALRLVNDSRVRVDASAMLRLPTGEPDSLRAIAPMGSGHGVPGAGLQVIGSLRLTDEVSLDWAGAGGWNGSREGILLLPDPTRPFSPADTRARVSWSPGTHVRVGLAPRVHLASAVSVAARWDLFHQGPDSFEALDDPAPTLPSGNARTTHSIGFELRFHGLRPPASGGMGRPFDAFLRVSGSVAGTEGAAVLRSVEGGMSIRLR
jgi:hypothetical protein